jgi:hypothetical protein
MSQKAYEASVVLGATPANTVITEAHAEGEGHGKPAEFAQFKRLTPQVLTVPKSELDEKLKKD